jgi:hypothetical protein
MSVILSFIKLPYRDKVLALKSLYWVFMVRYHGLDVFFSTVVQSKVQKKAAATIIDAKHPVDRAKLRIMIRQAARFVPRATCLILGTGGVYHVL